MKRKLYGLWLMLAVCCWCAASAGCGKGAPGAEDVLTELDSFTSELVKKVETAADPASGVDEAQKFFDARRPELTSKIAAAKRSAEFQQSDALKKSWDEREIDNVMRVSGLRTKFMSRAMGDEAFKTKLDNLVNDYQLLFKVSGDKV